jgi:hypothetical protein
VAVQLINLFQCNACKGTYQDQQRDGSTYHHACPPLPPDDNGVEAERPDKRDESIPQGLEFVTIKDKLLVTFSGEARRIWRSGANPAIRLEGAGVKCITDAAIAEPAWITAIKQRIAKEEEE